jgi:transaldolase
MYIEPLIGEDTINTLPVETLDAYRDHGKPAARLRDGVERAYSQLALLPDLGVDLDQVTSRLEGEGVEKFNQSYDQLLERLAEKASAYQVTS